jgi:hypothetical protein
MKSGTVSQVWRSPVKSMGGERLDHSHRASRCRVRSIGPAADGVAAAGGRPARND